MFETLAGKLRWERNGSGIRVLLPRRFHWGAFFQMIVVMCIPVWVDGVIRKSPLRGRGLTLDVILWTGLCIAVGILVLHLSMRTILTVTPDELSKTVWIFGRQLRRRSHRNVELCGLRKNLLVSERTGRDMVNKNVVEIGRNGFYHTIAYGLTDAEADALMAKMIEVYPFPEDERSQSAAGAAVH